MIYEYLATRNLKPATILPIITTVYQQPTNLNNYFTNYSKIMKRILVSLTFVFACQFVFAQESFHDHRRRYQEEEKKKDEPTSTGFDWNRVFVGGTISLGYYTGTAPSSYDPNVVYTTNTFNIGALPEIGYTFSKYFDLGISTAVNYFSVTSADPSSAPIHTMEYGLGTFVRFHPVDNFFLQAMPEQDFIVSKQLAGNGTQQYNLQSTAFLVGIGYGQREIGRMFFYTLLMLDVSRSANPLYNFEDASGSLIPIPIVRGGLGFYLGKRK